MLEEKLAVDAAIRKKLGYASLPEPASFMSTEMRKAWQTGDFVSLCTLQCMLFQLVSRIYGHLFLNVGISAFLVFSDLVFS